MIEEKRRFSGKKAIYYEDLRGRKPAKEFIEYFDKKTRGKILARVEFLAEHWHELGRPYVDKIGKGIYELRVEFAWNNVRILYAYMFKDYIVLLHGLRKKTDSIPEEDKLKATQRMSDFQSRFNNGMIRLK